MGRCRSVVEILLRLGAHCSFAQWYKVDGKAGKDFVGGMMLNQQELEACSEVVKNQQ